MLNAKTEIFQNFCGHSDFPVEFGLGESIYFPDSKESSS